MKANDRLVTVSFTRMQVTCEALMVLDGLLEMDVLNGETVSKSSMFLDLPDMIRFWLACMAEGGAFDPELVEWSNDPAELRFMDRLWQAHEEYYREINGPDWVRPGTKQPEEAAV